MNLKKIFLVRHGETAWSLEGKHTGRSDIPLTENGENQAKLIGTALKDTPLELVLVSPLIRAKATFDLSRLSCKGTLCDNLKEWNYGDYEGLTSKEIKEKNPSWNIFTQGAPRGESVTDIEKRADAVLEQAKQVKGDIAFFSSAHILRSIAARWLGMPVEFGKQLVLQTGSLSILGNEHGNPALLLWNKRVV